MKKTLIILMAFAMVVPMAFAAGADDAADDGVITIGMTVPGMQFPLLRHHGRGSSGESGGARNQAHYS